VDDPGAGRHHLEVLEGALTPAQERVALAVPLELPLDVAREGVRGSEDVDLDRVVDHELDGLEGIDALGVAAQIGHGLSHGCEIHDRRDPGEILEHDARRSEGDLTLGLGRRIPAHQGLDVLGGDRASVLVPQEVLEQEAQREGKATGVEPAIGQRPQAVHLVVDVACAQASARPEAVHASSWWAKGQCWAKNEARRPTRD
jgi:hypothetical protein